jgi:hypothetical protein
MILICKHLFVFRHDVILFFVFCFRLLHFLLFVLLVASTSNKHQQQMFLAANASYLLLADPRGGWNKIR